MFLSALCVVAQPLQRVAPEHTEKADYLFHNVSIKIKKCRFYSSDMPR